MKTVSAFFGNISLRLMISALVISGILIAITAMSLGIYASLSSSLYAQGRADQATAMKTAATVFSGAISGSKLEWADDGSLAKVQVWAIMPFFDNILMQGISRVTGGEASLYIYDRESKALTVKTTSVTNADGTPALEETIDAKSPLYAALTAGTPHLDQEVFHGEEYFSAYQPIVKENGDLAGVLFVGKRVAVVQQTIQGVVMLLLGVGAAVTVALGVLGYLASLLITRPIPRLARSMARVAEGDYTTEIPYIQSRNELGGMARAVEIFRENGLKVAQMTEAEAVRIVADKEAHTRMMADLRDAFGNVVDAAVEGDFSRRVDTSFPDAELNAIASSINNLVSTVDRGLSETGDVLGALAQTDLTQRVEGQYQGAFARLKDDTNAVADKLTEIVGQLKATSQALKTATSEILSGANDLSERTTRQAATIEETSAAIEQLATTVARNAEDAVLASDKASGVARSAEEGGQVMGEANQAMERISASSSKISNIIGMIDDIAFQTNLLALNASVEAARAGDAGKGFAVVAVEVRRLAQSAAQASSEVKALIEQSADEVKGGSRLVAEAADKLHQMLAGVRDNNAALDAIARASREQASAIDEVTTAIRQMDEMTQHNAALVEETNAAIEQTEAQASELDRVVDVFTIGQSAAPGHHEARRRAA
ncbi:methyl-accepting chemotaxis protein [Paradevosia shaoguanensis]|uniref:Methyl-accepting chemotaxis protein n=1 Tax=Paradevosia shaoguanensis TaxID=1335043 RepID=A0AA41QQ12_9HYPH|nr:methyl-accepting chemotaxis protein [Paradevosia shaoguanensis]MCF1743739.1 methyl-accepting chemotaxis protein [Paradevosia shaoguanensis]MCI0128222.1 methyl-accepting chemotaxis protein [Paradevosia shaoguanensis]